MTEIEKALMEYDGDNSKPYCDLVWAGLKELQRKHDAPSRFKAALDDYFDMAKTADDISCVYESLHSWLLTAKTVRLAKYYEPK